VIDGKGTTINEYGVKVIVSMKFLNTV